MSKRLNQPGDEPQEDDAAMRQAAEASASSLSEFCEFDLSLLEESLKKTPWERMQANDDALRFADSLRAAMEHRDAKSE